MNTTIITDCNDTNAASRQIARCNVLLNSKTSVIGVKSDLEAAGNLIDILDATEGFPSLVIVNVAPRNGEAKHWSNGTPFCYFFHNQTLVMSTIDGLSLALVKKLKVAKYVHELDIPKVIAMLIKEKEMNSALGERIVNSQFRSFDFIPRAASYLMQNKKLPHTLCDIGFVPDIPPSIWWIDNFGNCKTTLLLQDVTVSKKQTITTNFGALPFYSRLKDVPDKKAAMTIGSSGIGEQRFLEIVVQGGSAAQKFSIARGDAVL